MKAKARILLVLLVMAFLSLACVIDWDLNPQGVRATLSARATETSAAREFHIQLTAIAEQEK